MHVFLADLSTRDSDKEEAIKLVTPNEEMRDNEGGSFSMPTKTWSRCDFKSTVLMVLKVIEPLTRSTLLCFQLASVLANSDFGLFDSPISSQN